MRLTGGNARNGQRMEGNIVLERAATRLGYNGVRLTGEEPLLFFIEFAYSPLLTPFQCEAPQWVTYSHGRIQGQRRTTPLPSRGSPGCLVKVE
jgi:hypothetical protein